MFSLLDYLTNVSLKLDEINSKMEKAMTTSKDFLDLLAAIDAETTRIAKKIADLLAKIQAGGLTDEEETAVFAAAQAELDRMKTIGVDPTNPIPPVVTP